MGKGSANPIIARSTKKLAISCFNIVLRATIVFSCWIALGAIGIAAHFAVEYASDILGITPTVQAQLSSATLVYVVLLALSITVTSMVDVWNLMVAGFRGAEPIRQKDE